MSDQPIPLSDDDLDTVTGGTAKAVSIDEGQTDSDAALLAQAQKIAEAYIAGGGGTGDIAGLIGRAMLEHAADQRQTALDERQTARDLARDELLEQADEMKDAAKAMMQGAIVNMVMTMVGSAVSIGHGIGATMDVSRLKSAEPGTDKADFEGKEGALADRLASLKSGSDASHDRSFDAVSQFKAGVGTGFGTAFGQAEAKMAEAESQRDAYDTQLASLQAMHGQQAAQTEQQMTQMVQQIMMFIKEMQNAQTQAARTITRG